MLIDTHAHLHFDAYSGEVDAVLHRAREAGVERIITVGVNTADSRAAVELASSRENVWASVGIHPHDADEAEQGIGYIRGLVGERRVIAVGECGLDYFKSTTSRHEQERALRLQIELALERNLPVIFHVREAFNDFYRIFDDYKGVRGVVHSFTGGTVDMESAVERGLFIALNGIVTFTKDEDALDAARKLPLSHLLLETDCPFLSPAPNRGKRNEPATVADIAAFIAKLRGDDEAELARATTANAYKLFGLS